MSWSTLASNANPNDTNNTFDVFWRGRFDIGPYPNSFALLQRSSLDTNGTSLSTSQVIADNNLLLEGVLSPEATIDILIHRKYATNREPLIRLYFAFFHRVPDAGGLMYWLDKMTAGTTLDQVATSFTTSPEFINTYGSLNNTAFVTLVYHNVLGRAPDAGGLAHWVSVLGQGATRGSVMTSFSESHEGIGLLRPAVDTILVFLAMLRRIPTQSEFTSWFNALSANNGQPTEILINSLLYTSEYATRVGY